MTVIHIIGDKIYTHTHRVLRIDRHERAQRADGIYLPEDVTRPRTCRTWTHIRWFVPTSRTKKRQDTAAHPSRTRSRRDLLPWVTEYNELDDAKTKPTKSQKSTA